MPFSRKAQVAAKSFGAGKGGFDSIAAKDITKMRMRV
jgi:hypothetical protein